MSRRPHLLQVVPAAPPTIEGVSATAEALACALEAQGAADCDFLVPSRSGLPPEALGDSEADFVLIHYVNYAYAPNGCPEALVDDVVRWSEENPGRLWTYFHEVFASGHPWHRTFWVSRRQRRLASRLAGASSLCLTSLPLYANLLRSLGYSGDIKTTPIASTLGEPTVVRRYQARTPQLAVFGSPGRRRRAYAEELGALRDVVKTLGIEVVLDIGEGEVAPDSIGDIVVRRTGALTPLAVSELLLEACAGFVAYPLDFLGKSSIFAAYTSHGVLAACSGRKRKRHDDPRPGQHFWDAGRAPLAPGDGARLATNGHAWYTSHSLQATADYIAERLRRT